MGRNHFDLIQAYGHVKSRTAPVFHVIARRPVFTLEQAIERVAQLIGSAIDWTVIERFLPDATDDEFRRSALASSSLPRSSWRGRRVGPEAGRCLRPALCACRMIPPEDDLTRSVEAVLFAAEEPVTPAEIQSYVGAEANVKAALGELQARYETRGINLVEQGDGIFKPRRTWRISCGGNGRAPQAFARRDRDPGHHCLS